MLKGDAVAAVLGPELAVSVKDASYVRGGYRSYEFASFDAFFGRTIGLVAQDGAKVRDLLLSIAGFVRPTSGSLTVLGIELTDTAAQGGGEGMLGRVRSKLSSLGRERLPRGSVGIGIVSGLFEVSGSLSVEECMRQEFALRARDDARGADGRVAGILDHLAIFGLATHADRPVCDLDADARARLSAALACAGGPRVACIDLSDPFCRGVDEGRAEQLARDLNDIARAHGTALVAGTAEPRFACALDAAYPLDMESSEAIRLVIGSSTRSSKELSSNDAVTDNDLSQEEVAGHAFAAR